MNEALLDAINSIAGRAGPVDSTIRFFAVDGLYALAAVALVLGLLDLRSSFSRGAQVALAMVMAAALSGGMLLISRSFITEARPFVHDGDTVRIIAHGADNSFPSDHALVAAAIAGVAAFAWPRWGVFFVAMAFLVGFARVAAGVHYPADVLGGWMMGGLAAAAGWYLAPMVLHSTRGRRGRASA